jgi:nitrate/nitrite transporter NarK
MEAKKKRTGMNIGLMALMGLVSILAVGTMAASASGPFTDVPTQIGEALGISTENAGYLLSCAILSSLALSIAMIGGRKLSIIVVAVPMIAVMGFLVAVTWLPIWVLILLAVLVAYMFGTSIRTTLTGGQ